VPTGNTHSISPSTRKVLVCRIGVGRARVIDELAADREPIPENYDSFHIKGKFPLVTKTPLAYEDAH
jgi:hypothetical protein